MACSPTIYGKRSVNITVMTAGRSGLSRTGAPFSKRGCRHEAGRNIVMAGRFSPKILCAESIRRTIRADSKMKGRFRMLSVRADSTPKRFFLYLAVFFTIAPLAVAGQKNATNSKSWSGILVSSACNADEAFMEIPDCIKIVPGAKFSLYDDTNRVMYDLEPQEKIVLHLGDDVTVRGTLDGDTTIQTASIELLSIGLAVGQKAPSFSLHDQFGRVQTLDTLKGTNGTVLLFFRSADW
jgi:hypothetical protein